jgi:uncharacterized protein DUF2865
MRKRSVQLAAGVALALCAAAPWAPAQAGDFFSNLFGAFAVHRQAPQPPMALPFANDEQQPSDAPRMRTSFGGGQAWCVRTCDGRYFPISGPDAQSKTESCNSFCPASKTDIVYGNDIDHAVTANGKRYSELPNAFKYRNEFVAGCTCTGKNEAGLEPVSIDKDPTLRKGDIVASNDGLVVANPGAGRHAELNFTPVPNSVRMRLEHVPVVAKE